MGRQCYCLHAHTHVTHTRISYNDNNKTSCVSHLVEESDQYDSLMILENRTRRVTLNWHASKYKVHDDDSVGYNSTDVQGTRTQPEVSHTIEAGRTLPEVLHITEAGKTSPLEVSHTKRPEKLHH